MILRTMIVFCSIFVLLGLKYSIASNTFEVFDDLKKNVMLILLQGRGSYEDRMEMLRLIVDLVEASMYADNPEWRLDV